MSDTDFNKIKDKILSDLMIQVENEFQSGRKTVSGGKSGRIVMDINLEEKLIRQKDNWLLNILVLL